MLSLQAGYRRKIVDCVRLIDSTACASKAERHWARFFNRSLPAPSAHIYDPDADQPLVA